MEDTTGEQYLTYRYDDQVRNSIKRSVLICWNYESHLPLSFCGDLIDPFSISKHGVVFLWAGLRWRQKDSPDRFTNASYEVCYLVFYIFFNGWRNTTSSAYVRSLTVQDCDCYLNKLTLTDKIRLADPTLMDGRSDRITCG